MLDFPCCSQPLTSIVRVHFLGWLRPQYQRTVLSERDTMKCLFLRSFNLNFRKHKMFYIFSLPQSGWVETAVFGRNSWLLVRTLSCRCNQPCIIATFLDFYFW